MLSYSLAIFTQDAKGQALVQDEWNTILVPELYQPWQRYKVTIVHVESFRNEELSSYLGFCWVLKKTTHKQTHKHNNNR